MELDYSLSTSEERVEYVRQLLESKDCPPITDNILTILSDYILFVKDKFQTKKERYTENSILTANREITINKRQISYESLVEKMENGEDGVFNLITDDTTQLLDAKDPVTQKDIDSIPGLKESMIVIESLKKQYAEAHGKRRKKLRTSLIEAWKQVYLIKGSHKAGLMSRAGAKISALAHMSIPEEVWFDDDMMPYSEKPLSLLNPEHIAFLLQYYQLLKQESWELLDSDMRWHLIDLENLVDAALENKYPLLYDMVIWKIDGLTNAQIQEEALKKYGVYHSEQYFSSIWRKRIPRLIAEEAKKHYVIWFYSANNLKQWKKCSKCGELKPAHPLFYAKNSSKDGWYSQCKDCKNNRKGG